MPGGDQKCTELETLRTEVSGGFQHRCVCPKPRSTGGDQTSRPEYNRSRDAGNKFLRELYILSWRQPLGRDETRNAMPSDGDGDRVRTSPGEFKRATVHVRRDSRNSRIERQRKKGQEHKRRRRHWQSQRAPRHNILKPWRLHWQPRHAPRNKQSQTLSRPPSRLQPSRKRIDANT